MNEIRVVMPTSAGAAAGMGCDGHVIPRDTRRHFGGTVPAA
jgi:hypothetical protein